MCRYYWCIKRVSAAVEASITQSNIIDRQCVCSVSSSCLVTPFNKLVIVFFTTDFDLVGIRNIHFVDEAYFAGACVARKRCR